MIALQVYAAGLREGDLILRLGHGLETHAHVRYKVDPNHDMVYFEFDEPTLSLVKIERLFDEIGLVPRFVGDIPPELEKPTPRTERISLQRGVS